MKYLALLRGINVGGKNKAPMEILKKLFLNSGFSNVETYINSGNIIFTTKIADEIKIKAICEKFLKANFDFVIPVMIISAENLCTAIDNAPDWWNKDESCKHNAIFVMSPMRGKDVISKMGETKLEYEKVGYYGNVIFWSAPVETFSRTRYSKIASKEVYSFITIRNANTTLKLVDLTRELQI